MCTQNNNTFLLLMKLTNLMNRQNPTVARFSPPVPDIKLSPRGA